MIQGTFDIAVDTPKLHRRGTCELKSDGDAIYCLLKMSELEPLYLVGTCADKDFTFAGTGEFGALGEIEYEAKGQVWGSSITATCTTSVGRIDIFGTQLSSVAGTMKSSHEYMMKASTGDYCYDDGTMYSGLYADGG